MREKIVVTGMGAVTPVGIGVEEYWDGLISGVCGIRKITRFDASDCPVQIAGEVDYARVQEAFPKKLFKHTDPFTQYAYLAAEEALAMCMKNCAGPAGASPDAGTDGPVPALPCAPERMGITLGNSMAGITTICETQETFTLAEKKAVGPRFVPRVIGNMAAAQIAIPYGIRGPSVTISTACASGGDAIRYAALLLETGEADAVLTLGSESTLTPIVFYSLASAQALSKRNDEPEKACRPFDEDHSGFVMGEGGGALVLETETHAKARGAQIYAELAGWAATSDAWHVTAPHPEGEGAIRCLRLALEKAGADPSEIGYLNAHGTGTKSGDAAEALVIREVFGMDGGAKGPAVSSTKASTGHLMGAGGITEAIACIQALRTGLLPATISLETPAYDLDLVTGGPRRAEITAAMTNALGFGGQNSSLVFRKYH